MPANSASRARVLMSVILPDLVSITSFAGQHAHRDPKSGANIPHGLSSWILDLNNTELHLWRFCSGDSLTDYLEEAGKLGQQLMVAYGRLKTDRCCNEVIWSRRDEPSPGRLENSTQGRR
jgi:hypothetical protein